MLKRPYGKTGKDISVVSMGGMRFPKPEDIDGMAEIVLHAYRQGVNYFDTSPSYCGQKSEVIIGKAVKEMKAGTFYLATKSNKPAGSELRRDLETSLKRLNVDRIAFYHIWWILTMDQWRERKAGGAVAEVLKAKEEGLVEHVVVSSHLPGDELKEVLSEGILEGATLGYCVSNFPYREEAVKAAGEMKLGVVTMNPLGGGLIPRNAERFGFIKGSGDPSVVAAAIRFNLSNPYVTSALVGFTSKAEVDEAVEAVRDFRPYGRERITEIRKQVLESFGGLCTGCGYCLPCPAGVPIPKMMDAYNQKILAGGNPEEVMGNRLKWHWKLEPGDSLACTLCGACEEACTQHLPIQERLKEIGQIREEEKS